MPDPYDPAGKPIDEVTVLRTIEMARRGWGVARGLRRLVREPVTLDEARSVIADEIQRRPERFLTSLDRLVWPFPESPTRRLLVAAGVEPQDVRQLVDERGVVGALERLRDLGVYVSHEEYHGRVDVRRGSTSFRCGPADFFNPVVPGDYMAATSGSSGGRGTPMELSFAWQRRQGRQRPVQLDMAGVRGKPAAVWLPVFPSAAGFGAVMKNTVGGSRPERWFSQIPTDLDGITGHKQTANRYLPVLNALARSGLPSPEHVAGDDPEPVVEWMLDALGRSGGAILTGYASSLTAAARWAIDRGIDLTGVAAFPASEPVTEGKMVLMRAAGMAPHPMYAFTPEGTVALQCRSCVGEEYHVWDQDVAVITRRRPRGSTADTGEVDALLWTSLAGEAPRVLLNVENDDYGTIRRDVACDCQLAALGLRTLVADIRGMSKVVSAGISLDGDLFDHLAEVVLPARLGGRTGDYQFVEEEDASGATVVGLRVHPDVGDIDEGAAREALQDALAGFDNGALAAAVWSSRGGLEIHRAAPLVTAAGKILSFDRMRAGSADPARSR